MNLKKFTSGPEFLEPVLTEHNKVVDAIGLLPSKVSGSSGISVIRAGDSLSISLEETVKHFKFGIALKPFSRFGETVIQLCEFSGNEWHRTTDIRQVSTDFIVGYYFAGMPIRLIELPETKQLQIVSEGCWSCKAVADDDYNETFDDWVYATPANYPSDDGINRIQLYLELAETVVAGTTIYCNWDDGGLQWNGIAEKC